MRKSIASALAVVALGGSLGLTATQASAAPAGAQALPTAKFSIGTEPTDKNESSQKFKATKTGKIQYTLTKRTYNHSVGVRLITCGKDWKSLTGWVEWKKKYGQYYTFNKSVKKGTCFRVQAGRSWANNIQGKVKGNLKKA